MSADWNDETLDEILSDVRRMTRERDEAEAEAQLTRHTWSLSEVDELLNGDDLSAGYAEYASDDRQGPEQEQEQTSGTDDGWDDPEWMTAESVPADVPFPRPAPHREPDEDLFENIISELEAIPEPEPEQPKQRGGRLAGLFSRMRGTGRRLQSTQDESENEPESEHDEPAHEPEKPEHEPEDEPIEPACDPEKLPDVPEVAEAPEPDTHMQPEAPVRMFEPERRTVPQPAEETGGRTKVVGQEPTAETEAETGGKTRVVGQKPAEPKSVPKPHKKADLEMVDGQIMLPGYETDDEVEQVDEAQAAKELNRRRKETVRNFRVQEAAKHYVQDLPPQEDIFEQEPEPSADAQEADEDEYVRLSDRKRIGRILQDERNSAFYASAVLLLTQIALIVVSAIAGGMAAEQKSICYAICLVLLSLSAAFSIPTFRDGFKDAVRLRPSCKTAAALATIGALSQGITAFILPGSEHIPCTFCAAAVFSLLLCRISTLFEANAAVGNFKFCAFAAPDMLHTVSAFEDESDTFEIGKALQEQDQNPHPQLRYSRKTRFPAHFRRNAAFRTMIDDLCRILVPAGLVAALILALAGWIKTKSGFGALSAFTGALCVAMPAGAAFTIVVPAALLMLHLNRHGGMIASPQAALAHAGIRGAVVDAVDLFNPKETRVFCFHNHNTLPLDDMLLYAAALAIGVHSPSEGAFRKSVINPEILPPVRNLIYEEKLGVCGQIRNQTVLLGSRNLLNNHNVTPPPKATEVQYLQENKRILYLAVDGKVAAMFVIAYVPKNGLSVPLRILQGNDTLLLAYSPDCNVNEAFLSACFRLVKDDVRLISPAAGKILRERQEEETPYENASLLHAGTAGSFLRTLADAAVLRNIQRFATFIAVIGCGIGWLVSFILLLTVGIGTMNWIFATVYPAVWLALSAALGIWQARKAMQ